MAKAAKLAPPPVEVFRHQIQVLRTLSIFLPITKEPRPYKIDEIAELSGVGDEKEVQRYLYILEGQKLVRPYPEGDLTSKSWLITQSGLEAVKEITRLSS